jgi:hypothetical protein
MTRKEIEDKQFDLKAVNNNAPDFSDKRTTKELYKIIDDTQKEIQNALSELMK